MNTTASRETPHIPGEEEEEVVVGAGVELHLKMTIFRKGSFEM
jgi:hypothetical protein